MKRKNSTQADTWTKDSGYSALPEGVNLPIIWEDLAFGLVWWGREGGLEVSTVQTTGSVRCPLPPYFLPF